LTLKISHGITNYLKLKIGDLKMAFVEYERPSLPTRDAYAYIPPNGNIIVFSQDFLAENDLSDYRFISLWWDADTSKIAFRKATDISSLNSFDFIYVAMNHAFAPAEAFLVAHSIPSANQLTYDIEYSSEDDLFILTERIY